MHETIRYSWKLPNIDRYWILIDSIFIVKCSLSNNSILYHLVYVVVILSFFVGGSHGKFLLRLNFSSKNWIIKIKITLRDCCANHVSLFFEFTSSWNNRKEIIYVQSSIWDKMDHILLYLYYILYNIYSFYEAMLRGISVLTYAHSIQERHIAIMLCTGDVSFLPRMIIWRD